MLEMLLGNIQSMVLMEFLVRSMVLYLALHCITVHMEIRILDILRLVSWNLNFPDEICTIE